MKKNIQLGPGLVLTLGVFVGTLSVLMTMTYALPRLWNSDSLLEAMFAWFLWGISGVIVANGIGYTIKSVMRDRGYDI